MPVQHLLRRIHHVESFPPGALAGLRGGASSPLFRRHPRLRETVPWRPLVPGTTPVEPLPDPPGDRKVRLFVKRDDRSSDLYGGNKVRKLEHLLAEAALLESTTLLTFGGLGSNHALATALHGRAAGFRVELVLFDQPVTDLVRDNLLGFVHAGAVVHHRPSQLGAVMGAIGLLQAARRRSERPYFVNAGGTSRLGALGYAAAALELADQVERGEIPEPDRIFVPLGTCGTAAGLAVGLRMAGLRSRIAAVRVAGALPANRFVLRHLAQDLADWLRQVDPSVEPMRFNGHEVDVVTEYRGPAYGVATPEALDAARWIGPALRLEPTYTGKTLAACLDHCWNRARPGEVVLFWNTYNSVPVPRADSPGALPRSLQVLF